MAPASMRTNMTRAQLLHRYGLQRQEQPRLQDRQSGETPLTTLTLCRATATLPVARGPPPCAS